MRPDLIDDIRVNHRERCYAMEQRKRADLSLGSFLKVALGWSKSLPDAERKAIATRAAEMVKVGEDIVKGKDVEKPDDFLPLEDIIVSSVMSRAPFDTIEARATKAMKSMAEELPVWEWSEGIRGLGACSLSILLAEAGDISNYDNPSKLNKRFGVAVMSGVRQGGLSKSAKKDDWIAHGYSRKRRSMLWNIGEALVKTNQDGEYRTAYLERKEYEVNAAIGAGLKVAPSAKIPKGKAAEYRSDGHIHARAKRFMEKRLLRNLWRAWREATSSMSSTTHVLLAAE